MKRFLQGNFIYFVVALISLLLVANIFFTIYNNTIIQRNKELQHEAETIKLYTEQIGKSTIHGIDIGIRGYAIIPNAQFFSPVDSAILRKDSILYNVESRLKEQNYDMREFYALRDSLNSYVDFALYLKQLLLDGKEEEFKASFSSDKGLYLWLQYVKCLENIGAFEDKINREAEREYQAALKRNYLLQLILFLICCPTLIYTAIHTRRTVRLSEQLHLLEAEKNKMLSEQNQKLEMLVAERTQEIAAQSEEIYAQKEEISAQRDILADQNKKLHEVYHIIEEQKKSIESENEKLETEVYNRTHQLREANKELIEHNSQLEQFAFIAAHNLRAPLARILGLANVIELSDREEDKQNSLDRLVESTKDLDNVIKDLNTILDIKKHVGIYAEVDLQSCFARVLKTLERPYKETGAMISTDFSAAAKVFGVGPYVESILYNLLSNAIKYRHPERTPVIHVKTTIRDGSVCLAIEDNGLGIDLNLHQQNMFSLYKRFHLHMEGKGVGLYLVKTQMEALGGKVEVISTPEEGSTFLLYFKPVVKTEMEEAPVR
jgi:signal transduction histidine kinase